MKDYSRVSYYDATRTDVPYLEETSALALRSPASDYAPAPQQPPHHETNLGFILTSANLLVSAIIITGMIINGSQVMIALIVGGCYFALTTSLAIFTITGALSTIVGAKLRETTERQRIDAYERVMLAGLALKREMELTRRMELAPSIPQKLGGSEEVPAERLSPLNTFVAAYSDESGAKAQALEFIRGLYTVGGLPNPRMIHLAGDAPGRLRVRMIGSKRGSGSRDAGIWLLQKEIIVRVRGGYALNLKRYPHFNYLPHE